MQVPIAATTRSIGLGFLLVRLDNGACGLACTMREDLEIGCAAYGEAGKLLTAATIMNNTLDSILRDTGETRETVLLGAGTPYAPSAFSDTPVTALAGSVISRPEKVRAVVCEGCGTRTMGRALGNCVERVGGEPPGLGRVDSRQAVRALPAGASTGRRTRQWY